MMSGALESILPGKGKGCQRDDEFVGVAALIMCINLRCSVWPKCGDERLPVDRFSVSLHSKYGWNELKLLFQTVASCHHDS